MRSRPAIPRATFRSDSTLQQIYQAGERVPEGGHAARGGHADPGPNRKLQAFAIAFGLVAAVGLVYTFARPAEYRAQARVEITPAEDLSLRSAPDQPGQGQPEPETEGRVPGSFLGELQRLTSRPLLALLHARLQAEGLVGAADGGDPVPALQSMIAVSPVAGTQVVALTATGPRPQVLAPALNGLLEIYQAQLAERYRGSSDEALARAKEEVARVDAAVADKRAAMAAFQARHGIVSLERDENMTLSQTKGLGASLAAAEDKAVAAEASLRSLKEAIASGQSPVRARDNPTLAAVESRLGQAREEYRQLERSFTEQYLAMDPNARALKARIGELESQLSRERAAGLAANLADAQAEASRARAAVDQLRARLASDRQTAQAFSARFGEYKALQDELTTLEKLLGNAQAKSVRLEASQRARQPRARIIEPAATPSESFRPPYLRDAAISLAAAVLAGFLTAWLTAFLTRRDGAPSVVVAPTAFAYPVGLPGGLLAPTALAPAQARPALAHAGAAPLQLPAMEDARELKDAEVDALLRACDGTARAMLLSLLGGLAPEELAGLRWSDVDLGRSALRVRAPSVREFPLTPTLSQAWQDARSAQAAAESDPVLSAPPDADALAGALATLVACAAHDAGLDQAAQVTPASLRHTFLAFMARQGARFSELARVAGPLPAGAIAYYSAMAPAGERRAIAGLEPELPGVRLWRSRAGSDPGPGPA